MVDRKMDDERVISCLITGSHRDWYVEHGRAHVYVFCLTRGSLLLMQSVGLTKIEPEFLISTCQQ